MMFYKLKASHRFEAELTEENIWDPVTCPANEGHKRPRRRNTGLYVILPSTKVPHFLTTFFSDQIITDEVAKMLEAEGFTGFTLRPVTVRGVKKGDLKEIPKLWELVITGQGGNAHPKSEIRLIDECNACGSKVYTGFGKGLFVDETQWDGSDFFTIWPLPKYVIVSERVKEFIKKHKFKNCKLTPTPDLIGTGEEGTLSPC